MQISAYCCKIKKLQLILELFCFLFSEDAFFNPFPVRKYFSEDNEGDYKHYNSQYDFISF